MVALFVVTLILLFLTADYALQRWRMRGAAREAAESPTSAREAATAEADATDESAPLAMRAQGGRR